MKKKNKLVLATALAMAAFTGGAQVTSTQVSPTQQTQNTREIKGTEVKRDTHKKKIVLQSGGMDLVHENYDQYGLSPKEYGIRYGHGNKSQRSNRLRMSHNAKLKRRLS